MRRILLVFVLFFVAANASANYREFLDFARDPSLETSLRRAAEQSLRQFPNMKAEDLAISMVDLSRDGMPSRADYHGDVPFYPASVIKLFFLADVYGTKKESLGDVDRAMREMITVSDNDATAYLVDILADTSGGTELQGRALQRFIDRRRNINRRFERLGYRDVSAMMKPWSFGPYGRERQLLGENRVNRNKLTANATTSLMTWIVRRRAFSAAASEAMLNYLARPIEPQRPEENQVKEFIGEALPASSKLWSKAGWTGEVRHDVAYVELPDGRKFVLTIFTRGQAADTTLIPAITRNVLAELR